MNFLYTACTLVLLLSFSSPAISCSGPTCKYQCKKDPPLKLVYQAAAHFREVQGCGRKFTTTRSVSSDGVRSIKFQTKLRLNEIALELCRCLYGYISQRNWLDGSTKSCCVKENVVTMTLKGRPDREFKNPSNETPLELFARTFHQFRYGDIESHHCVGSTSKHKADKTHFHLQCDLRSDSPPRDKLCAGIMRYLNQDNWVGQLAYKCDVRGKALLMEIKANDGENSD